MNWGLCAPQVDQHFICQPNTVLLLKQIATVVCTTAAEHIERGELVYVHCKAGRGRSTSLVLCYLIKHRGMAPLAALEFVQARRPQVRLHPVSCASAASC